MPLTLPFTIALAAACLCAVRPTGAEPVREVKDIGPRADTGPFPYLSGISRLVAVGDRLVFPATSNDGTNSEQLWSTDGTETGTIPLGRPFPRGLTTLGRIAVFFGGNDLWRTDGTQEGTVRVKESVFPGYAWCDPDQAGSSCHMFVVVGRVAFFFGWENELWRTDGTETGTFRVKTFATLPGLPIAFRGRVFFSSMSTAGIWGLYSSDGTEAGTRLVKRDVYFGGAVVAKGTLFFESYGDVWVSDGSGRGTVRLTSFAGKKRSANFAMSSSGRAAFFGVSADDGPELWTSDGTRSGTRAILQGEPLPEGRYGAPGVALNGVLFFLSPYPECRLWRSDGTTAGTRVLKDLTPGFCEAPIEVAAGRLFFSLYRDWSSGSELWTSDGTEEGTRKVAEFPWDYYAPGGMTRLGPWILFGATLADPAVRFGPQLLSIPAPVDVSVLDAGASRKSCDPTVEFRVALSGPSEETITVDYATVDGSARAGQNYDNTLGTLTFPPGSTSGVVQVPLICGNAASRIGGAFFLDISNPTHATLARSRAKATLRGRGLRSGAVDP